MTKKILINALGINDSGGITVFLKLLEECRNENRYAFLIVCHDNENIKNLIEKFSDCSHFEFVLIASKSFLHRLYYENIVFRKIIKENKIDLVYNFSGSAQFFLPIPQITKVHNLLFYSKTIDKVYFEKKEHFKWMKQVFFKRVVFHTMIKQTQYIEVQSNHVKEYMADFLDISKKQFFIKSDIDVTQSLCENPKRYDFSKEIRFLYIVGPHFQYLHKNFQDFVQAMMQFKQEGFNFEIIVTLTKDQLHASNLWDRDLDKKTKFLGYIPKEDLKNQFQDNTILISTSVIETLGLHVVEAVENGILAIVPNAKYSLDVYGGDILTYELFHIKALLDAVKKVTLQDDNQIKDTIQKNRDYLIKNEKNKYRSTISIFDVVSKEENVQK